MSDTEQTGGVVPPKKRRLPGILLLLGVFLAGMLCGGGLAVLHVMHRIREGMQNPEMRTEHIVERMSRQLDLTPEQQKRVRAILQTQEKELGKIRKESWPKVVARMDLTEKEIGDVLMPDQREHWRAMVAELRRRVLPGGLRPPRPPEEQRPGFGPGMGRGPGGMGRHGQRPEDAPPPPAGEPPLPPPPGGAE